MTEEKDYDLGKSAEGIGKLVPILKDKRGNIIDGFHRKEQDPNWFSITIDSVDDDIKLELARLATNFCRRRYSESELHRGITFLLQSGMKVKDIAEQTGISIRTIQRYTPIELKPAKSALISDALQTKSELSRHDATPVASSIKNQDTLPEKTDLVSCDNCKMSTHISRMRTLDLCPSCYDRLKKVKA